MTTKPRRAAPGVPDLVVHSLAMPRDHGPVSLVLGWPVDPAKRREVARIHPDGTIPRPYSGSIEMPCAFCGMAIWIGPRSQEIVTLGGSAACPWCSVLVPNRSETNI